MTYKKLYEDALYKLEHNKITLGEFEEMIKPLNREIEPRKGHWINKYHLFESCSAECSSCHTRSDGYMHDNGFSLECKYYDFCPKCGSNNREVEE